MGNSLDVRTAQQLAQRLGVGEHRLDSLATNMAQHVTPVDPRKKSGGTRRIFAPSDELKHVQRLISRLLLQPLDLPDALHGSVPGRSTITNARPHTRKAMVVSIDIRDFYPSIHFRRVRARFVDLGCSPEVAGLLTKLTTYEHHLAQGFPTSSAIANLVLAPIVPRLEGLCAQHNCEMTLYQDDLTISGDNYIPKLVPLLSRIFQQAGFQVHPDKVKVMPREEHQEVTGWTVNRKVNTSKKQYRQLRAILHRCSIDGIEVVADRPLDDFRDHLRGRIQRVNEVNPSRGQQLLQQFSKLQIRLASAWHDCPGRPSSP